MDLFTRYRTILVMFVLILFVSLLLIRYFFQTVRWTDYLYPFAKGFFIEGYVGSGDLINIPIWKDEDSTGKYYNIGTRPDLVSWKMLKENAAGIEKDLTLNNMSFSFWIYFDESVRNRPKTSIFHVKDTTSNPPTVVFSVFAKAIDPTLEINYLKEDRVKSGSNVISYESDLYGGNQIGYNHTPTFVFITIQNGIIRFVVDGVEQNKFGGDGTIFEPTDTFVIGSGATRGGLPTSGILIRDFRIYADPVESSTVKVIFDAAKKKKESFSTKKNVLESFMNQTPNTLDENTASYTVTGVEAIQPPTQEIVGMKNLQMKKMGDGCNIGGAYYDSRGTYKVDRIMRITTNYANREKRYDVTNKLRTLLENNSTLVVRNERRNFILRIKLRNDYGEEVDEFDIPYTYPEDVSSYWDRVKTEILNKNTKNVVVKSCPSSQQCLFFNAGRQEGKCVTNNSEVPGPTDISFTIMKFSQDPAIGTVDKIRTISMFNLNESLYYTFLDDFIFNGNGTTFSFWFKVDPIFFANLAEDEFLYLMHCGDESWQLSDLSLKNEISISVNKNGDVKFFMKNGENNTYWLTSRSNVLSTKESNYPQHIAWVVDSVGNWNIYHNGVFIRTYLKAPFSNQPRQFNMVGGSYYKGRKFPTVSIGDFKIFNYVLGHGHIKYLYENN